MAEFASKVTPPVGSKKAACPEKDGANQSLTSPGLRFFSSFSDALRVMPELCPKGAIVVLLDVPDGARSQALHELNSEIKDGKRIWSVKDAQREVMNSPYLFPPAEKFVIHGYRSLLGGSNREQAFQLSVAKKCSASPAFVLTNEWPDPITLGKSGGEALFNFAWAKGFFTPDSEVMGIRYDNDSKTFEIGRGTLASAGASQCYTFSNLAPEIPAK
jgi:hypothetical protein